ncbi:MAG: hypothetical protein RJB26_782 [Pseudomonadota bacterium]
MKEQRRLRITVLAAALLATPLAGLACTVDSAKPFTSGPLDSQGMFPQWVVDGNGVSLQICNDSLTNDGNPPPCFYDPVEVGNPLSQALGRGAEAFMFLADSVFVTPGAAPIDAVMVMGVETAFLGPVAAGNQTQFQRLRTRLNVNATGIYTVETPWGIKTYRVDTLLKPGNGQNRAEVSDPVDITFTPSSTVPGLVAPFLIADNKGGMDPNFYIGDGLTPSTVTGSPCGRNFVRITAVGLDGVTPVPINTVPNAEGDPINVYTNRLFTVSGKRAPMAEVPLAITSAYYSRIQGVDRVTVMAEGSTSSTQSSNATAEVLGISATLTKQDQRYYATIPVPPFSLPQQVTITALDPGLPSVPNTKTANLTDLVGVTKAEALCTGFGSNRSCTLTVIASSSDDGSGDGGAPVLTVQPLNLPMTAATPSAAFPASLTFTTSALPAAVKVVSSKGGVGARRVTVINQ